MDRSSAKYASFENVYKIKITYYILSVKFKVEKHPAVEAEISGLEQPLQNFLKSEYKKIENEGIEFVKVRPLQDKIFEIKSNELRSLFRYKEGRIIVVGVVFVKKTQKTPQEIIQLAKKIKGGLNMEYVFVKDAEGFILKKLKSEICADEHIISEKEYMQTSGLALYEKKFGRGGARENAGRKQKFSLPLEFQIRVTREEKDFISYARRNNVNYSALMKEVTALTI